MVLIVLFLILFLVPLIGLVAEDNFEKEIG